MTINDERAVRILRSIITDGPDDLRSAAIEALDDLRPTEYPSPARVEYLCQVLRDPADDREMADRQRMLHAIAEASQKPVPEVELVQPVLRRRW